MVNERIIFYLGFHETVDDAQDAIKIIKKTTKKLKNKKIMIIENAGWIDGHHTRYDSDKMNEIELKNYLKRCKNIYKEWIYKINNAIPLDEDEINWPTTLYKFGYDNNFMTFFEIVDYNIVKKMMSGKIQKSNEFDFVQKERDEFFIRNQIIPLVKENPEITILIIRGLGHKEIISELFKKFNISYKEYEYGITTPEEASREADRILRKMMENKRNA